MRPPALVALALVALLRACNAYEYDYEHEFWLRTDGSGTVHVTGRPALWAAFKGVGRTEDPEASVTREGLRVLFEGSGLRVRRVTLTRREGRPYLFVAADFDDVNRLAGTPAFPDLRLTLARVGDRLRLEGEWRRPEPAPEVGSRDRDGLMAVRFHLPSRVYEHRNASAGVERGNIVAWRQDVARGRAGAALPFGALMDSRSILGSTVALFAAAIGLALGLLALALWLAVRRGRRAG
ncbi:MAG TPA: hypothetical protein VFM88_04165 [Vicinamibacteria bacterium]|nr:hypothetical protein [Vicinamibacteria bacterium]